MPSKFQDLIDELGTGQVEKLVKPVIEKKFTKVKHQVGKLERGLNFMSDILHLPTTRGGFKYLLVIVDLADNSFDIEPLKEIESDDILKGMRAIFRRDFIETPSSGSSFQTDGGAEYSGATHKYLYDQNIYHKVTKADRHKQQSNVERLNRTLGRFFNNYMSRRELENKGRINREWIEIVPIVRERLNDKIRLTDEQMDRIEAKKPPLTLKDKEPKYKVGDLVYYKLDEPVDISGRKQTGTFREGDRRWSTVKKKIKQVLFVEGDVPFRYMLNNITNASYTEDELMKADGEQTYVVSYIVNKRKRKGKTEYLIHWRGFKKKDRTWEPESKLLEDGFAEVIEEFNKKKKQ